MRRRAGGIRQQPVVSVAGGSGTGPVTHGNQLTVNNVGPWTLQGVAQGSENLVTVPVPGRGFWQIATPSEYAPTSTYVVNNNPTNRGGVVGVGGATIDGYSFPAGTVVCQFSDLSGSDISCQGQGGQYLFRGCRFRSNGIGQSSQFNDFTSTYINALHYCDMGSLSANIADWQGSFWKMIGGGPHRALRNYMTYQYVALQPNTNGFECIENYIDKITFYGGNSGPPGNGGPLHIAAIGCEGGVSGFRIMRNRIFVPSPDDLSQWVIANGATVAMEGTGGGTYTDCQVVDNYIAGANYAILDFGEVAGQTNIVITGNTFTTMYWTGGGLSGIEQAGPHPVPWGSNGNVKSNNTFQDDYGTGGTGSGTPLSSRQYPLGNGPLQGTAAM